MNIQYPLRLALLASFILLVSIAIVFKIIKTINSSQYVEVDHLKTELIHANSANLNGY